MSTAPEEFTFVDEDGIEVFCRRWLPAAEARAIVVVVHGAAEHSGRYARFADTLAREGYAVYALDLPGHGRTAASTGPGRIGTSGVDGILDDMKELVGRAAADFPALPIVLFGHSMGSLMTQAYVESAGDRLAGYVLCGSMGVTDVVPEFAAMLREAIDAGLRDQPVDTLGGFDGDGEGRTKFDWLSRDDAEVDKYIADPMCGDQNPLTYGYVAATLEATAKVMDVDAIEQVPKHLSVLLIAGDADPVSNGALQVRALEQRLRDARLDVAAVYYSGARHELLNETNRAEVQADVVEWLARVVATR
ncbi:MAG TPA: alpha/beta hydrolase [Acidimicrobiia bacterium]